MPNIRVRLKKRQDDSYHILIEDGLTERLPALLKKEQWGEKYAIIADTTISRIFGKQLIQSLKKAGIEAHLITFPPGDASKSISQVERSMEKMLNKKFERSDAVIALGGGVTGDLAGFIASIYMRGIPYIHIPTSLIAMADSAIGGKTGINLKAGKNLAGRVYQPKAVYMDPLLLNKLPERELLSGMGEIIKCAIIQDPRFFTFLEKHPRELIKREPRFLKKIITKACHIKVNVVQKDEHENGHRRILNYGHTIGHALEKISNYSLTHGEAIAMGMKLINIMSVKKKLLPSKTKERINNLINDLGILDQCDQSILRKKNAKKIWKVMQSDKKAHHGTVSFVLVPQIGTTMYEKFTEKDLSHALEQYA